MISRIVVLATWLAASACSMKLEHGEVRSDSATSAGGGYRTTRFGPLSDTIIHLANGDSAELQSSGPVTVPKQPQGLMVTYHPSFGIDDTARVTATALLLFDALRPRFVDGEPPWIVLRAADRAAAERNAGGGRDAFYGVVIERHPDGHWYRLNGSTIVRQ